MASKIVVAVFSLCPRQLVELPFYICWRSRAGDVKTAAMTLHSIRRTTPWRTIHLRRALRTVATVKTLSRTSRPNITSVTTAKSRTKAVGNGWHHCRRIPSIRNPFKASRKDHVMYHTIFDPSKRSGGCPFCCKPLDAVHVMNPCNGFCRRSKFGMGDDYIQA